MGYRIFLALGLWFSVAPWVNAGECVDLSLVLAIDSSGSIDDGEFALQSLGYAAALRSPEVKQAIATAGKIEVAVVFWADSDFGPQIIPWHQILSPQGADEIAAVILSTPRKLSGDTNIGSGLNLALDLLEDPGRCSIRKIVNVSGDGQETFSPKRTPRVPLEEARLRANDLGVVVNALAIENEDRELADYYKQELITGSSAFVMSVSDFSSFGTAIKLKLEREIRLPLTSTLGPAPASAPLQGRTTY